MNQIYGAKDTSDVQQLYETPPEVTKQLLAIARLNGFSPENTVIGELFNGNGMMSRVAIEENYSVITRDKYTDKVSYGEVPYDFYYHGIPEGVNLLLTNPPFRGKRDFFRRLQEIGAYDGIKMGAAFARKKINVISLPYRHRVTKIELIVITVVIFSIRCF